MKLRFASLLASLVPALAAAALGGPDPGFGNAGSVRFDMGQSIDQVDAMALYQGQVVVVGRMQGPATSRVVVARYGSSGLLDDSFGQAGLVRTTLEGGITPSMAIQADGKVVVFGSCANNVACVLRLDSTGRPDAGFGNAGMLVLAAKSSVSSFGLQPDGKIVGVVSWIGDRFEEGIFRATGDGVLDASFGSQGFARFQYPSRPVGLAVQADGKLVVAIDDFSTVSLKRLLADGTNDAGFTSPSLGYNGSPLRLAIQPDGKILTVGCEGSRPKLTRRGSDGAIDSAFGTAGTSLLNWFQCPRAIALDASGRLVLALDRSSSLSGYQVVRLASNGTPDALFGTDAHATANVPGVANSVLALPDGRIIAGGAFEDRDFGLARITAGGALDTSYGNQGIASTELWGGRRGTLRAMAVSSGKVVVLAEYEETYSSFSQQGETGLRRFLADGSFDATFGIGGQVALSLQSSGGPTVRAHARSLVVLPDSRILVAGFGRVGAVAGPVVMRLTASGSLDPGFGENGRRTIVQSEPYSVEAGAQALALLPDGSIVAAGKVPGTNGGTEDFVARLDANGTVLWVRRFASATTVSPVPEYDRLGIAVQPDGKFIVTGVAPRGFSALRMGPDGSLDPGFGSGGRVATVVDGYSVYSMRPHVGADGRIAISAMAAAGSNNFPYSFSPAIAWLEPSGAVRFDGVLASMGGTVHASAFDGTGILLSGSLTSGLSCTGAGYVGRYEVGPRTGFTLLPSSTCANSASDLAVLPDGKTIVAAHEGGNSTVFALHRLSNAGIADYDADSLPDGAELDRGRDPRVKDNDVFSDARLFAMQQYRDFLGREGDETGVDHWTAELLGAQSRAQMVRTFFESAEFQGVAAPVARLYFAYFLRIPDYPGLQYWIGQYRLGSTLEGLSNAFATSAEFVNAYGALDNAGFVDRVYRNVLGRAPDAVGLGYWKAQIDGGMTRGQMMVAFSESPEYRTLIGNEVYVTMTYMGMLRRAPDATGFASWVAYLDSGASSLDIINGFLNAIEYRNRFLP